MGVASVSGSLFVDRRRGVHPTNQLMLLETFKDLDVILTDTSKTNWRLDTDAVTNNQQRLFTAGLKGPVAKQRFGNHQPS